MNHEKTSTEVSTGTSSENIQIKLTEIMTPGVMIECHADEALLAGAFLEDALSEDEALESQVDMLQGVENE